MFYSEGDDTGNFGLVGGDIRVFKTASNGRELTLYHVRDGQACLINLLCVVLKRGAMASAVTEEATDAALVPADVFRNLLTKSEALRRFVFETTASRVVDILALVEEITVRRMDARLASLLPRRAANHGPDGAVIATHDDLAAELGTAREVVSRVLKEMERRGAVRLAARSRRRARRARARRIRNGGFIDVAEACRARATNPQRLSEAGGPPRPGVTIIRYSRCHSSQMRGSMVTSSSSRSALVEWEKSGSRATPGSGAASP